MALTFNSTFYYANRPDVLEAYLNSDLSVSAYEFALNHYNTFGWKEGYNPNEVFNTVEYLDANPDVKAAGINPFDHYNNHGQAEGRSPNATIPALEDFDAETYLAMNPDLGIAGITTAEAAYDHYITFGYAENRPGSPDDGDFLLKKAVAALQDAQEARDAFLAAADGDNDPATAETLGSLEAKLDAAEVALGAAPTERALQADLTAAQTAVNGQPGLAAAVNTLNARAEQLEAALAAQVETNAAIAAEVASFEVRNAENATFNLATPAALLTIDDSGTPITVLTVNPSGQVVLAPSAPAGLSGYADLIADAQAAYDASLAVTAATNSLNVAIQAVIAAESGAYDSTDTYYNIVDGEVVFESDSTGDLSGEAPLASALLEAQTAVQNRAELVEAVASAQSAYDQAVVFQDAVDAAFDAIEALGYEAPAPASGAIAATADSDLYVYTDDTTAVTATITGFGVSGDDLLFLGDGFGRVDLAAGVNLAATNQGNAGVLEFFVQQDGLNTILYVEDDNFDGSLSTGPWGGNTITLVGVDASSVVYENGFIRIADAVA